MQQQGGQFAGRKQTDAAPPSPPGSLSPPAPPSPPERAGVASAERWTTRRLLGWMGQAFQKKELDSPRLCAELLVSHVLGCERMRLYMDPDRPATPLELETLRGLTSRALAHEPVQYLVGKGWFFSLPFKVDRRVLIPRPSSETIVEHVLQHARAEPTFATGLVADICTGSGCLAISILKNMPGVRAAAADLSAPALEVARENAEQHGVADRIDLLQGDLLAPIEAHPVYRGEGTLNYIVANPPYIPDSEWNSPGMVGEDVRRFEPESALRGGADGLKFVLPILERAPRLLKPGGLLLIEIASVTAPRVEEMARAHAELENAKVVADFEGQPRVLIATRSAKGSVV